MTTEAKPMPVVGPLLSLLSSQKFMLTLLCGIACFVLVLLDRITLSQAGQFMGVVLPAFLLAHGIQDGMKAFGASNT